MMLKSMVWQVGQFVSKVRWVVMSVLWSCLLLSGLFLFAFGPPTPAVEAASPEAVTQTATIAFASDNYSYNEHDGDVPIVLSINPVITTPITVTVSSANIQAEASQDFEGVRQALVISPSMSTYTISVTLLDDSLVEGAEQLRLTLSNLHGAVLGPITDTIITIEDDDFAYLYVGDVTVDEEAESVSLIITQSTTSTLESLVDVRTVNGSATSPEDFDALFTTVTIPPGSTEATVTVQLNGDELIESSESFFVTLEDSTNAVIGNVTATVTLSDNDTFPEIGVAAAEANETDGVLPFVVSLSTIWDETVTVEYATADGSAIAPNDYLSAVGVLMIPPGTLTATVDVVLVADQVDETDESFYLVLTNPVQAILSNNEVEGTIHDTFSGYLFLPGLARE